ncbi:MAG TPA: hypothetical protein VN947_19365 [Polyangia bacterium]|jgi:hypothetical protein|nr:hypothetical protein [Polyangia bacterium]
MRKYFFEGLALLLILGSLGFFVECVHYLGRHDYVAAILLLGVGISVSRVGAELARLALVERD